MIMSNWALAKLSSRQRLLGLAGAALAAVALLTLIILNQPDWRSRAAALERENTSLQLAQLARELTAQSDHLLERTRELADSDAALRLVQETTDPSADRLELADLSRHGVDALLVLSASRAVRFSIAIADGQLAEQAPDPALVREIESIAAEPGNHLAQIATFGDDRWIAVRPVFGHSSPAIMGWVAASRSLTPQLTAQLAATLQGRVVEQNAKDIDLAPSKAGDAFSVTSQLSADNGSGSVILRDARGRAVRVLKFTRSTAGEEGLAAAPAGGGVAGYVISGLLSLLIIGGGVALALRRYFRHQRSVDARYKALIDQANDGIVIVDAHTLQVLYTNPAFLGRLGYSNEEAQTLSLTDIFVDPNATPDSVLSRLIDADSQMAINLQQRCKSGQYFDTEVRCNALDVDGRDVLAYVTHDVSLRRKAEQQLIENQQRLDKMAHHDQLTGLPNRHYLTAFLPQAIEEARAAHTMLGVVFLDLDRFKHINDTRGHETGDKLLQEVATRLRECVRDSDVVIRMGGDEFVVVFRNVKNYDEVTQGAGRIIETLNRPIVIDRHPLQTTGSVGVSLYPRDGADMIELLKHSDTAMYQAKDRGRNNVQMFSHAMNRKLKHRVAVEASLREALRLKQLDVHYQPFVNLVSRKIVGLEALMRWSHPVHGMIPADQFIPVAEETGLIVPVGRLVLREACRQIGKWNEARNPALPPLTISVNLSSRQLLHPELLADVKNALADSGLEADKLKLEITESVMMEEADRAIELLDQLKEMGILLLLDDFGTGYSSLAYLHRLPIDTLKIDRSFISNLHSDLRGRDFVETIVHLAHKLGLDIICEGVELEVQANILIAMGAEFSQGFFYSRPVAAHEAEMLLAAGFDEPSDDLSRAD